MSIEDEIRLKVFADAQILHSLSTDSAWESLSEIGNFLGVKSGQGSKYYGLINGYKWVATTALYGILDEIIGCSELWGLEPDERLKDWWGFSQSGSGVQLQSALTTRDSQLSSIVLYIDEKLDTLRRASTWEHNKRALAEAGEFGNVFLEATHDCVLTATDDKAKLPTIKEVLRLRALERLLDYLEYEMTNTYTFVWRRKEDFDVVGGDDFWLEPSGYIETHLDLLPRSLSRPAPRESWRIGYIAAICVLLRVLDSDKEERFDTWTQFDRLSNEYSAPLAEIRARLGGAQPSEDYGIWLDTHPRIQSLVYIKKDRRTETLTGKDKLTALMGNETRLIASNDFRGGEKFRIVVAGVASILKDGEKIEIIRIPHPSESGNIKDVSLAVRVERVNSLTNTSMWWVFYRAYSLGRIFESAQHRLHREISDTFAEFEEYIKEIESEDVNKEDLLALCEPPVWRYVFNAARKLLNENTDVRGVLPEVLTGILLAQTGYQHIRTSFRDSVLFADLAIENPEVDAIGIKPSPEGNICLVVEAKGESTSDIELAAEVKKFGATVRFLRERLSELADRLDFKGEITHLKGCFISMGAIEKFGWEEEGVELWGFTRFVKELKKARISKVYTRLLKKILITEVVDFGHRELDEAWFHANDDL